MGAEAAGVERRYDPVLRLLKLLRSRETAASRVTVEDMCEATGWKPSSARTYVNKKFIGRVLFEEPSGSYRVAGAVALSDAEFIRLFTQSKARERFGHSFAPLVRELLERSRTNVALAIELFNRPTLPNRLDGFVLLFVAAWEQLLKAELDHASPGSIFTGEKTRTGRDKTIGLQDCIERSFKPGDVVRRNLETIRSLRDDAAHLLVRELQPIATRYFQAGVGNYVERFQSFTGEAPLPVVGAGLLTLAMPYAAPDVVSLRERHGQATAREIDALVSVLEDEARTVADERFAIAVEYRLVLENSPGAAAIHLTKGKAGQGVTGLIVEKPVDAERRYRFFPKELADELSRRTGRTWSLRDVEAVLFKERLKASDNEHHHLFRKTGRHAYSDACLELIERKFREDPDFLERARTSLSHYHRTTRARSVGV